MKNLTLITLNKPGITDFAAARNAALDSAKTEWVLFVDQDEVLTPELKAEIQAAILRPEFDAYALRRRNMFLSVELHHGEAGHTRLVRLAKKSWGRWERPVHEVWKGKGRVGELKNPLLHNSASSLANFLAKINHYSSLEAEYRHNQGRPATILHPLIYPLAKFVRNYLLWGGILDGVPGLIHAFAMSFHSYLTWGKLYILWHKH